ncbi:unnamed protein product [Boreogadus saida]
MRDKGSAEATEVSSASARIIKKGLARSERSWEVALESRAAVLLLPGEGWSRPLEMQPIYPMGTAGVRVRTPNRTTQCLEVGEGISRASCDGPVCAPFAAAGSGGLATAGST